jgi:hypothetical protein
LQSLVDNFPAQQVKDEAKRKLKEIEQADANKRKILDDADTLETIR